MSMSHGLDVLRQTGPMTSMTIATIVTPSLETSLAIEAPLSIFQNDFENSLKGEVEVCLDHMKEVPMGKSSRLIQVRETFQIEAMILQTIDAEQTSSRL